MLERLSAEKLRDLLLPMSARGRRGVYFVRLCNWDEGVRADVWACHEAARKRGVLLEGQMHNPDDRQLSYMRDVLGTGFAPDADFLAGALEKWMPRMSAANRQALAREMAGHFTRLAQAGKPESAVRNLYAKLMCWLYYRFDRLMPLLGRDEVPMVLYDCRGITAHELLMLRLINALGADILLLEPMGDEAYLRQDPDSAFSQRLAPAAGPFPEGFSLKQLRREMEAEAARQAAAAPPARSAAPGAGRATVSVSAPARSAPRAVSASVSRERGRQAIDPFRYFAAPQHSPCTNVWMKEADYTQVLTPPEARGDDERLFYNAFIRVNGVEDRQTYLNGLHRFYRRFQETRRKMVIADEGLAMPGPEEVEKIRRRAYRSPEEMIVDLAGNLPICGDGELQRILQRAFLETMTAARERESVLSRLLVSGVYLLCWIRRWHTALFQGYRAGYAPCFVLMGGCRNAQEGLYLRFLSRTPADVLIFAPDLSHPCQLADERLLELTRADSLPVMKFPRDAGALQVHTVAAHAQEDLNAMLYADSGLYRNHQFARAEAMTLKTTYDELFLLWDQALKYRPGFAAEEGAVTMPVLYARVCGVERGDLEAYWRKIRGLLGPDTRLVPRMPMIRPGAQNPCQALAAECLKGEKLRRSALREDRRYPFSILREELQQHILDKLQLMLDRRLIRGSFENGTEYTVVSTVLNMDRDLLRTLQSFDFARKNPKLVCIDPSDRGVSLEDAILITFLNLVGFDILLFVPTGYRTIERYLNDNLPVEHQIGDYCYDLTVPDLNALPQPKPRSWLDNLLRRGH